MLIHKQKSTLTMRRSGVAAVCLLAAWLGSAPYIGSHVWRAALALPGGFLVFRSFQRWLSSRQRISILEQFKYLLEHLMARMSAGATLEKAFIDAPEVLADLIGRKSSLLSSLQHVEQKLLSHQPIDRLLSHFEKSLPCPEAAVFFKILPGLRHSGGHVGQFVRQNLRMTMEKITLYQEASAETTQRRTEAGILAVLPFGLTVMLQKTSALYDGNDGTNMIFTVGMMVAYMLAAAGVALALSFMSSSDGHAEATALMKLSFWNSGNLLRRPGNLLQRLYQAVMTDTYLVRLTKVLQDRCAIGKDDFLQGRRTFFEQKFLYMLVGLTIGISLSILLQGKYFWIAVIPATLSLLQDFQAFSSGSKNRLVCRMEYPVVINLLTALLQAGMSLHNALAVTIDSLMKDQQIWNRPISSLLRRDLTEISRQIHLGLPSGLIVEKISLSCSDPEIQAAMLLLARYERTGGQEVLDLLQIQSSACWNLYRQAVRKQMEQQSLKLLLPMMLDLSSVILTAILPAWISFRTY